MKQHIAYIAVLIVIAAMWTADHRIMREELTKQWRLTVQAEHAATYWRCKFNLIDPIRAEAGVPLDDNCKEVLFGRSQ